MSIQMQLSVILITLVLVFYTIGVWSERLAGQELPGQSLAQQWISGLKNFNIETKKGEMVKFTQIWW